MKKEDLGLIKSYNQVKIKPKIYRKGNQSCSIIQTNHQRNFLVAHKGNLNYEEALIRN